MCARVLLADDHPAVAEDLRTLLQPEFDVIATVGDGYELVADGLARLLEDQKPNIVNAMPSGLSSAWRASRGWVESPIGRASVSEAAGAARASAATGASAPRWVLPVLAVVIVAGLLWWWIGSMRIPQQTATAPQIAGLTGEVNGFFLSATNTFAGIKGAASA